MALTELIKSYTLPDLTIPECIPNCNECPGIWVNECIGHRIMCQCKKCQKHNANNKRFGEEAKLRAKPTQTQPTPTTTQPSNKIGSAT
jgi:hypothetical protein